MQEKVGKLRRSAFLFAWSYLEQIRPRPPRLVILDIEVHTGHALGDRLLELSFRCHCGPRRWSGHAGESSLTDPRRGRGVRSPGRASALRQGVSGPRRPGGVVAHQVPVSIVACDRERIRQVSGGRSPLHSLLRDGGDGVTSYFRNLRNIRNLRTLDSDFAYQTYSKLAITS